MTKLKRRPKHGKKDMDVYALLILAAVAGCLWLLEILVALAQGWRDRRKQKGNHE